MTEETPEELLDLSRLDSEERELWDEFMTDPGDDGPALRVWSFGYICMLELGRVPEVAANRLHELDPENNIRQYLDNMRRARYGSL